MAHDPELGLDHGSVGKYYIPGGDGSGSGFWSANRQQLLTALAAVGVQFTKRAWVTEWMFGCSMIRASCV